MKKIYLHPLPVRLWHWINAGTFLVLIITGLQIRYKDMISLMGFKTAVSIHNFFGIVLALNFLLWLIYYVFSGNLRVYLPALSPKSFLIGSLRQARYYGYGIFFGEENPHKPTPEQKFNPMQQMAYLNIMALFLPLQILSGLMMWDTNAFRSWIALLGGIRIVDTFHVLLFFFFTSFLFIHIYLATLGHTPTAHIKAMISGFEEEHSH